MLGASKLPAISLSTGESRNDRAAGASGGAPADSVRHLAGGHRHTAAKSAQALAGAGADSGTRWAVLGAGAVYHRDVEKSEGRSAREQPSVSVR